MVDRELPGDPAAPVVRRDAGALVAERGDEPGDVAGELLEVVRLDGPGLVGVPVAALVGRDGTEPRGRERVDLARPRVPELGEPVQQDDREAVLRPGLDDEERDLPDVDPRRLEVDAELALDRRDRVEIGLVARELADCDDRGEDEQRDEELPHGADAPAALAHSERLS